MGAAIHANKGAGMHKYSPSNFCLETCRHINGFCHF